MASSGKVFKPFHESIVDRMEVASKEELAAYGRLLIETAIPADHDKIIETWCGRCEFVGITGMGVRLVMTTIELQKQ